MASAVKRDRNRLEPSTVPISEGIIRSSTPPLKVRLMVGVLRCRLAGLRQDVAGRFALGLGARYGRGVGWQPIPFPSQSPVGNGLAVFSTLARSLCRAALPRGQYFLSVC